MLSRFSPVQLFVTLWTDYSLPGSSVYGILQARILEWAVMPLSRGSSRPKNGTCVSYTSRLGRQVLYHKHHLGSTGIEMGILSLGLPKKKDAF